MKAVRQVTAVPMPARPHFQIVQNDNEKEIVVADIKLVEIEPGFVRKASDNEQKYLQWERAGVKIHFTSLLEALQGNHHQGINTPNDVFAVLGEYQLTAPQIFEYDPHGTDLLIFRICREGLKNVLTATTVPYGVKYALEADFMRLGEAFAATDDRIIRLIKETRLPRRGVK